MPPPPPKQFTDEELKQQYGIHLATRLQSDEPDKGSKWADMEDDEDDWAPDTVEWRDGTRTTVQAENQPPHPPEPQPTLQTQESKEDEQPLESSKPSATSIGPGKAILRPGTRATQSITRPGLILKSVPENQSPLPQSANNGNSKSPWAQLPPIDKVSPVTFHPPAPSQMPSHLRRDSSTAASATGSAIDSTLPTPSPAREIAADTFERSWRTHDRGSRELFDAKSGRYEPARSARRASFRQDGGFRPPALLQRPSHSDQDATYASQDARNPERRPSSLNVDERARGDTRASGIEETSTSDRSASPFVAKGDTSPPHPTPSTASDTDNRGNDHRPYSAHPVGESATSPHLDSPPSDVQLQQQLMRQRIEANRRRKQEEQAREEAAKQERIREKLKALDKTSSTTSLPEPTPDPNDALQPSITLKQESASQQPLAEVNIPTVTTGKGTEPQPASPSKFEDQPHLDGLGEGPTVASSSSFTPVNQAAGVSARAPATSATSFTRQDPQAPLPRHAPIKLPSSPQLDNFLPQNSLNVPDSNANQKVFTHQPDSTAHLASSDYRILPHSHTSTPQPFERSPQHHWAPASSPHTAASWSSISGAPPHLTHSNVWGPPSSDKALGNGSFDSEFHHKHHFPRYPQSFRQSPQLQPPIGPPSTSPRPQQSPKPDYLSQPEYDDMSQTHVVPSPTASSFPSNANTNNASGSAPPKKWQGFIPGLPDYRRSTTKSQASSNANNNARAIQDAIRASHHATFHGVSQATNQNTCYSATQGGDKVASNNEGARWQAGIQNMQDDEAAQREKFKQERLANMNKTIQPSNVQAAVTFKQTSGTATDVNDRAIVGTTVSKGGKTDEPAPATSNATVAGGITQSTGARHTSRFFPTGETAQAPLVDLTDSNDSVTEPLDALPVENTEHSYLELPSPEAEDALFDKQDPQASTYPNLNIPGSGCILIPIRKTPPPQYVCVKLPDASAEALRLPESAPTKAMPPTNEPVTQVVQPQLGQPFPKGPGYNGAARIVDTLVWQQRMAKEGRPMNMDELKKFYVDGHSKAASQDAPATPITPKTASEELASRSNAASPDAISKSPNQCIVTAKLTSEEDRTMVVVPGQVAISGSKADDATETKSQDGSVFADPENGSRPAITLAKDLPAIDDEHPHGGMLESKHAPVRKPDPRSKSPLTPEQLRAQVKLTASMNGKYGTPGKKPTTAPQPTRKPASTNNITRSGSTLNGNNNANSGNPNTKPASTVAPPARRGKTEWARPSLGPNPPSRKNW